MSDEKYKKPIDPLPTRQGKAIGAAQERQMSFGVDTEGFKTIVRNNPDGSTTTLKTRGGFNEFVTDGTPPIPQLDWLCFKAYPISKQAPWGYKTRLTAETSTDQHKFWERSRDPKIELKPRRSTYIGNVDWYDSRTGQDKVRKEIVTWAGINSNGRHGGTIYVAMDGAGRPEYCSGGYGSPYFQLSYQQTIPFDDYYPGTTIENVIAVDGVVIKTIPAPWRILSAAMSASGKLRAIICTVDDPAVPSSYHYMTNPFMYGMVLSVLLIEQGGGGGTITGWTDIGHVYFPGDAYLLQAPFFNSSSTQAAGIVSIADAGGANADFTNLKDYVFTIDFAASTLAIGEPATEKIAKKDSYASNYPTLPTTKEHNTLRIILAVDYVGDAMDKLTFRGEYSNYSHVGALREVVPNSGSGNNITTPVNSSGSTHRVDFLHYTMSGEFMDGQAHAYTNWAPGQSVTINQINYGYVFTNYEGRSGTLTQASYTSSKGSVSLKGGGSSVDTLDHMHVDVNLVDGGTVQGGDYYIYEQQAVNTVVEAPGATHSYSDFSNNSYGLISHDLRKNFSVRRKFTPAETIVEGVFDLISGGGTTPELEDASGGLLNTYEISHRYSASVYGAPAPLRFPSLRYMTVYYGGSSGLKNHAVISHPGNQTNGYGVCQYVGSGGVRDLTKYLPNTGEDEIRSLVSPIYFRKKRL